MTNENQSSANVKEKSAEGLVSVMLEVHLWSGLKRLRKEQLVAQNQEFENLPPATLATLGSIKICDKQDLAPFTKLKREAEKMLAVNGLAFLGSMAVPEAKLEKVFRSLARMQLDFNNLRDAFLARFDKAISDWRSQPENAEWTHLIHDIPSPERALGKMSFGFHLFRVHAPSHDDGNDVNKLYTQQMTGLKGELFADAAKEAETLIDKCLTGKKNGVVCKRDKVTWKTLRPLKRIAEKFSSFAFLDPSCEPMADMIDHVLRLLPDEGPIEGVNLMHIWTLAEALTDPKRAMSLAGMAFSSESPALAFQTILAETPPFTQAPTDPRQTSLLEVPSGPVANGFLEPPAMGSTAPEQQPDTQPVSGQQEQPSYVGLF